MAIRAILTLMVPLLVGCKEPLVDVEAEGPIPPADVRALFIGNSLTSYNNLPGMVEVVADAAGHTFAYRTVLRGGYALEDHWYAGVELAIGEAEADFVVMQQGPSSTGPNQAHLREWTIRLSGPIEAAGGVPALYMVWPEAARIYAFDAVLASYRNAAAAVDGLFIPAGEAWREVWAVDPEAELYGPDDFHPSPDGTFVAALAVYAVLFDEDPRDLPPLTAPGVTATEAAAYAEAVHAAIEKTSSQESDQIMPRTPQR